MKLKYLIILAIIILLAGCGEEELEVSETWQFHSYGVQPDTEGYHFSLVAPEVLQIDDGYRMFAAHVMKGQPSPEGFKAETKGIGSFFSEDNENWVFEKIIIETDDPYDTVSFSHSWVIEVDGGYRMFAQSAGLAETPEHFGCDSDLESAIWSWFSEDGKTWEEEGEVIGPTDWFFDPAHGRAQKLDENNYIMVFSATTDCGPADVLIARSTDGENWDVDKEILAVDGHDPTIIYENGILKVYYKYKMENFFYVESHDNGLTFSEPKLIKFVDKDGKEMGMQEGAKDGSRGIGDIDYDGVKYMWTNNIIETTGPNSWQLAKFVKVESDCDSEEVEVCPVDLS